MIYTSDKFTMFVGEEYHITNYPTTKLTNNSKKPVQIQGKSYTTDYTVLYELQANETKEVTLTANIIRLVSLDNTATVYVKSDTPEHTPTPNKTEDKDLLKRLEVLESSIKNLNGLIPNIPTLNQFTTYEQKLTEAINNKTNHDYDINTLFDKQSVIDKISNISTKKFIETPAYLELKRDLMITALNKIKPIKFFSGESYSSTGHTITNGYIALGDIDDPQMQKGFLRFKLNKDVVYKLNIYIDPENYSECKANVAFLNDPSATELPAQPPSDNFSPESPVAVSTLYPYDGYLFWKSYTKCSVDYDDGTAMIRYIPQYHTKESNSIDLYFGMSSRADMLIIDNLPPIESTYFADANWELFNRDDSTEKYLYIFYTAQAMHVSLTEL